MEEEEESKLHKVLRERVPFAVVGANTVVEHDGRKVRGRKYPWGVAEGIQFKRIVLSIPFSFVRISSRNHAFFLPIV